MLNTHIKDIQTGKTERSITNPDVRINSGSKQIVFTSVCSVLFLSLLFVVLVNSIKWINRPFHNFLVMRNQVVASIGLPHWEGTKDGIIFQSKVVSIDNRPINGINDLWNRLKNSRKGEIVHYTFVKDNNLFDKQIPVAIFSYEDFFLLFGLYIFNGIVFFLSGYCVYYMRPKSASGLSLFVLGTSIGIFTLTACDLYSPYWFFNLHVLSEAFLPAAVFHLALTFPYETIPSNKTRNWILLAYLTSIILSIFYELLISWHKGYVIIHNLCTFYFGLALLFFVFSLFFKYLKTNSPVVKYRIRTVMWGAFAALFAPSVIVIYSAFRLGEYPVNIIAFTTFIFPIVLGYAIVKRNLFEIDKIIQRSLYYLILSGIIILIFSLLVISLNSLFEDINLTRSPYFLVPFTILMVLIVNPLKDRVQSLVDKMFYHIHADYQKILKESSTKLTTLLNREAICQHIIEKINEVISPEETLLMALDEDKQLYIPLISDGFDVSKSDSLKVPGDDFIVKKILETKKELTAFDIDFLYDSGKTDNYFLRFLYKIKTQVIIPLIFKSELKGFLITSRKKSGFSYHSKDIEFLKTLANHATLSLVNWQSYEELKTAERELLQSEKLKLVGQMANMIIHDFKGPMTSIRCVAEFITIGSLSKEDIKNYCNKIMGEIDRLVEMSKELTEFSGGSKKLIFGKFNIEAFIKDITSSLEEILKKKGITLDINLRFKKELTFDYEKMKRVFHNIFHNAIEAMPNGGFLSISNQVNDEHIEFCITDTGKGIPARFISKIFDPFFTSEKTGGTGLGLCIVKDIINNHGGDIWVTSHEGHGTAFYLTVSSGLGEKSSGASAA